jgi:hypothetical protein
MKRSELETLIEKAIDKKLSELIKSSLFDRLIETVVTRALMEQFKKDFILGVLEESLGELKPQRKAITENLGSAGDFRSKLKNALIEPDAPQRETFGKPRSTDSAASIDTMFPDTEAGSLMKAQALPQTNIPLEVFSIFNK